MAVSSSGGDAPRVNAPRPTAVWQLGPDGDVRLRNRAADEICGRDAGAQWRDGWPDEVRAAIDDALAAARTGETARFRAQIAWDRKSVV